MRLSLFSTLFLFSFIMIGIADCKDPYQQKCQEICGFFTSCVEKQFESKGPMDPSQKSFMQIECESGCLREQGYAMPCYESEKTCTGFTRCLMESGLMD